MDYQTEKLQFVKITKLQTTWLVIRKRMQCARLSNITQSWSISFTPFYGHLCVIFMDFFKDNYMLLWRKLNPVVITGVMRVIQETVTLETNHLPSISVTYWCIRYACVSTIITLHIFSNSFLQTYHDCKVNFYKSSYHQKLSLGINISVCSAIVAVVAIIKIFKGVFPLTSKRCGL